ncbi:glycosyltransferase [Ancylomarina salipaludis]|uniref:Glycosyltransferase n=1 Tax=Ancylomarina salipaludis TaxID=2501299 RepID=A0A4Q1JPX0_9BACT|nr:glycosyltransferase [Ancylomarina salipaludis]RXQ97442.1 glycosyltransferase [Ancylomarina salipaludis]
MKHNSKVLVSIGIPFYNSEAYLDFAIRSVLNQTYTHWQLILLDDGSKDSSLSIAKKYQSDPRVTVVSDGLNKGLPARLNELSLLAEGKYYARMDADDIMFPNRIETQVKFLEENPNLDVLGCCAISIDTQNNIVGKRNCQKKNGFSKQEIIQNGCFIHPSVMGKRSWFVKNTYNIEYRRSQDLELWMRTVDSSDFHVLDEPMIFYREVGVPTFKKYYQSVRVVLSIYNKYMDRKKVLFYFKLVLKLLIYFLFYVAKQTDFLIKKRSENLSNTSNYYDILHRSTL